MEYKYSPVGLFYNEAGFCECNVWAPLKENVELAVVSSDGQRYFPLTKDERGYWKASLNDLRPGTRYLFRINNHIERPDPASMSQPDGVHGASEVIARNNFNWTDENWKGMPLSEMIIYELHIGTFTTEGNFKGVIERLPYLVELGITAIEIMPVAQFPGTRNWGYDLVYPFAVQHSYGGADGLKALVNAAHGHGIAVILDVVYNHLGPEGNYLPDFAPYLTDKYKTPWGNAINFDDAWSYGVRQYYIQNALMWLDDFHIDALRLDAVHAIWDNGARHWVQELRGRVNELENNIGRKKLLIAELDLNNPRYINCPCKGGYGLDAQWVDEFHHALHSLVTKETNGYYEDFGKIEHVEKAFRNTYVYSGEYSPHRKKEFGAPVSDNPYDQFVVFIQNHDQIGNRLLGDRLTATISFEATKLLAAAVLLSPYVPLLFMGEEYGEKSPFQYFVSHSDDDLLEATRKGRREEFSYFNWEEEIPDPAAVQTFTDCILTFNHNDKRDSSILLRYYQNLIAFRKNHPAMQNRQRNGMIVYAVQNDQILAFKRMHNKFQLLIILNLGDKSSGFNNLSFSGVKIFDSSDMVWGGPNTFMAETIYPNQTVPIAAHSAVIFKNDGHH